MKFTRGAFLAEVANASGMSAMEPADQARYLNSYLANAEASAESFIVEKPYVDRHFLEEFTGYYASGLRPPQPKTTRLHFFDVPIADKDFSERLQRAAAGHYDEVKREFEEAYLGFVVIRPLAFAPIGRTLLRPYGSRSSRCFAPAATPHRVHLAGLELEIQGLPFQQQDQAVGACATTAIWSSLSRVMRTDGQRPVPPFAITSAATQHLVSARPFPAVAGLDQQQILGAIRALGYSPDLTKNASRSLLQLIIKCYVGSGIPVIVQLHIPSSRESHALAVAGYRESDANVYEPDILLQDDQGGRALRSRGLSRLYVHDDRLGPYARMLFVGKGEETQLQFQSRAGEFAEFEEPVDVWSVIAPLYPKLRLSAVDLIAFATEVLPLMTSLVAPERLDELRVDISFALAGHYLRTVLDKGLGPERTERFLRAAMLSRYVGIIRFSLGDAWLADIVCDTTDIRRDVPAYAPVIAACAADEAHATIFARYFKLGNGTVTVA